MSLTTATHGINLGISDPTPIWAALVEDTHAAVMLLDADGQILFANDAIGKLCDRAAGDMIGRHLKDLWPEDFARERLDMVREAAATGRTVTVDGMIRGRWVRTVFRALSGEHHGRRRVLAVSQVAATGEGGRAAGGALRARVDDRGALSVLTPREIEILRLIGCGLTTAAIADKLHRSVKTVEWHRVSLGNKLGAANRVELARIAINAGLVDSATSTPG